jgi:lipopolysaccharide export system protein LptC
MVEHAPSYIRTLAQGRPSIPTARGAAYSRFVGWMKIVLPVTAVILLALVLTWPKLMQQQGSELPPLPGGATGGTDDARAHHLAISGFDKHDQPFTITALQAIQEDPGGDSVVLEAPSADITLNDGVWLAAKADSGHFNRKTDLLRLSGSVNLFHDEGFELRTDEANVDVGNGVAWSDTPVEGFGPQGELHAEGLEVLDRGDRVVFTGRSRLTIYRGEQ